MCYKNNNNKQIQPDGVKMTNNATYEVKKNKPFFYAINTAKFNFFHMVFKVVSAGYFGQVFQ